MLERARRGCYPQGTLKELPDEWIDAAFDVRDAAEEPCCLRPAYRHGIEWKQQDIRDTMPDGPFDLILCRNLVFTYFDAALQHICLRRILDRLVPHGLLVLGKHETLPEGDGPLTAWDEHKRIYQRTGRGAR
jgi:chemotaxis protein methyltransferase CheR